MVRHRGYNPANRTEEGPVNQTARWPDRLEHLATLLRADALALVTAEGGHLVTLFSHRLSGETDWPAVLGSEVFAGAEAGPVAAAVAAGRWKPAASFAVVARVRHWTGTAFLVALRQDVPFDAVETLGAAAAADLVEMSATADRQLADAARQGATLAERVQVLERLRERLAHARDTGEVLARAAEDVARRMGAGAASIMVVEGDQLRLRASVGLPHSVPLGSSRRLGEGIAGWAAARRETIVLHGSVDEVRFKGVDPGAGEAIVTPIVEGNDVLGVLNVKRPELATGFRDRHELLGSLASDLGTVLREVTAIDRLRRERELAVAQANVARAVAAHDVRGALEAALGLGHHAVALRDATGEVLGSQAMAGDAECRDAALAASDAGASAGNAAVGPGNATIGGGEHRVGFARHGTSYAREEAELAQQTADTLALLGRGFSPQSTPLLRVLTVEDHPIMRLGIRAMLEREGMAVAGASATCAEAIGLLRETAPDVVLLDLRLPDTTGTEAVTRLREVAPTLPIVVFSIDRTPALVRAALRAGANGYVTKDAPIARLVAAIRAASAGLVVMGQDEAAAAAAIAPPASHDRPSVHSTTTPTAPPATPGDHAERREPLTPRELELLRYMAEGYTNKEVARAMVLAEDTVKKAVQTLIAKLGAADRTHAVVIALRTRLID